MNLLNKRANGVLMHISSLPGNTGIGTLGKNAYSFVDFLKKSSQTYWQILPIGPTSYGDSPYQSFSTFAGNPYFIDFELLEEQGLLAREDYENVTWGSSDACVDYGTLYIQRHILFEKIQINFEKNIPAEFYDFCENNAFWLDNYSLFMAVKDAHNGDSFLSWEEDIVRRDPEAVKNWTEKCTSRINYYKMLQYLFFTQWNNLKKYANDNPGMISKFINKKPKNVDEANAILQSTFADATVAMGEKLSLRRFEIINKNIIFYSFINFIMSLAQNASLKILERSQFSSQSREACHASPSY